MLPGVYEVLWVILPAWMANSWAINVKGLPLLKNFSTPIDFGYKVNGKRILGDGKTWRGLFGGVSAAVFTSYIQMQFQPVGMPQMTLTLGFLLGFGAVLGDMVESFIKRRSNLERGHPLFLMDHLDYIFGAFFMAWLVLPVDLGYLLIASFLTVPVHFIANIIAWKFKLKKNPW